MLTIDKRLKNFLIKESNFQSESEKQRLDYSQKLNELNQSLSVAQQDLNAEIKFCRFR